MSDLQKNIDETKTMLKLSCIPRWTIVEMNRQQSVGEHSFNVWIMACALWRYMFPVEHNSFARASLQLWALTHDMDEIFTGDMPTTVKDVLNRLHPGIMGQLKEEVMRDRLPGVLETMRGVKGSLAYQIVALVDVLEALKFVGAYATREEDKSEVFTYLATKFRITYSYAVQNSQSLDWDRARAWFNAMLPSLIP